MCARVAYGKPGWGSGDCAFAVPAGECGVYERACVASNLVGFDVGAQGKGGLVKVPGR